MCRHLASRIALLVVWWFPASVCLIANFNDRTLSNSAVSVSDDLIKLPSSIVFDPLTVRTLPTNEGFKLAHVIETPKETLDSEKKLEEINESIKDGSVVDPVTKEKLFQNEGDETEEIEEKEVSLDSSGQNYKDGVDSTAEDMNDISKKLQSDGGGVNEMDDVQLRENLLDTLLKSQHRRSGDTTVPLHTS